MWRTRRDFQLANWNDPQPIGNENKGTQKANLNVVVLVIKWRQKENTKLRIKRDQMTHKTQNDKGKRTQGRKSVPGAGSSSQNRISYLAPGYKWRTTISTFTNFQFQPILPRDLDWNSLVFRNWKTGFLMIFDKLRRITELKPPKEETGRKFSSDWNSPDPDRTLLQFPNKNWKI